MTATATTRHGGPHAASSSLCLSPDATLPARSTSFSRSSRFPVVRWLLLLFVAVVSARGGTITVNSTADPVGFNPNITMAQLGPKITFRDALNAANLTGGATTINFSPALAGSVITLNHSQETRGPSAFLVGFDHIASQITVQGLTGENGITLGANGAMRLFLVYNQSSSLTLNDLTLTNGKVLGDGGGAMRIHNGTATLNRCTITQNSAYLGGGLYNENGQLVMNNCTIAHNTAAQDPYLYYPGAGGGIYQEIGTTTLTNCTIEGNSAERGGGIHVDVIGPLLVNTIVAQNYNRLTPYHQIQGTLAAGSHHNLIGGSAGVDAGGLQNGTNNNIITSSTVFLDGLGINGGPTATAALLRGSPAINAAATVAGITTDQRGITRPQFSLPDIGAFEFSTSPTQSMTVTTLTDENNGNSDSTFGTGTSLREALIYAQSLGGTRTITFDPSLAGKTVLLSSGWANANDASALNVTGQIILQGPAASPGVSLGMAPGVQKRHLYVASGGSLTVSNLTFTGGNAPDFGGSIWSQGSLTVKVCTFTGNTAGAEGGAIQSWGDSPLLAIDSSTFSGNTSNGIAGAIDCGASIMLFRHVTIAGNSAANGNAVVIYQNKVTAINTIIAANSADGVGSVNGGGFSAQSTNNLLGGNGTAGLTNGVDGNLTGITADQLNLAALANNGGPTATRALPYRSAAVDRGVAIPGFVLDQRGSGRLQAAAPDIGAFELIASAPSLLVTTAVDEDDKTSDPNFGSGTSLREAISYAQGLSLTNNGGFSVSFASSLAGHTFNLNTGWNGADDNSAIRISAAVLINGSGVKLVIPQGAQRRHFLVEAGGNLNLSNLVLTGGQGDLGGSVRSHGSLAVSNCTFTGNSASQDGGAIYGAPGSSFLQMENSTFTGNSSGTNASAISCGSSGLFRYITVTGNTGGTGAMLLNQSSPTMINSLIDGNSIDGVITRNGSAFSAQSTNNLLGTGGTGGLTHGLNGNQTGVPIAQLYLGPLANNGGQTPTIALLPGSLAIDAGNYIPGYFYDQRGQHRSEFGMPDVGAYELVQTPAVTPTFGSSAGTYASSVQVTIATSSVPSTVRYTLDGSDPSPGNGQLYSGPFQLTQSGTVKAVAYGRGWQDSLIASIAYNVQPPLPFWRGLQGLSADGSQDLANPSGDGISNLLKYAFNLAPAAGDLARSNYQILSASGTAGLPLITTNTVGQLSITFVRRKTDGNPGISYFLETSADVESWNTLSLSNVGVVSIDGTWERVTVIETSSSSKRFARVRVQAP